MPPALKARVLYNISNRTRAKGPQPEVDETQANATQLAVQPIAAESVETSTVQRSHSVLISDSRAATLTSRLPEDGALENESCTSTLPNFGTDDSAPFTTAMIVNDDEVTATPSDCTIQVKINPTLGIPTLVETPPPALLFQDMDVRPNWLIRSINQCLQYAPYYMCLNKVVDLFLTQEARLGYPDKVSGP